MTSRSYNWRYFENMAFSQDGTLTLSLCITEKWIRDRLNLQIDSLDSVRSLSLPGSYGEKITHLERSLLGFTRLKHLDLSRNALESLQGLDHLKQLETLNLYYNNIASLKELFRLRHNSKLKELDLRLNPATKNEPDYRLFIIHMLVNLRKLDDRSVRDSERKAAIRHFDTDQAHYFDQFKRSEHDEGSYHRLNHINSRKHLVNSLASRATTLEDDTDELLELIAKSDSLLTPNKQHHRTPGVLMCNQPGSSYKRHVHSSNSHSSSDTDSNKSRQFSDEADAYVNLKIKGNFTPAPVTYSNEQHPNKADPPSYPSALKDLVELMQGYVEGDLSSLQLDSTFTGKFDSWFQQHHHPTSISTHQLHSPNHSTEELQKQLETLKQTLQTKEVLVEQLQSELSHSKSEACALGERLKVHESRLEEIRQQESTREEVHQLLQQANKDMAALQQHMQSIQEENILLKRVVEQTPNDFNKLNRQISELQAENHKLKVELNSDSEKRKQEIVNAGQIQELASMLQESHSSLVATNDHLLRELDETKQRHSQELMQMNMNYEHLKKTVTLMQHA